MGETRVEDFPTHEKVTERGLDGRRVVASDLTLKPGRTSVRETARMDPG